MWAILSNENGAVSSDIRLFHTPEGPTLSYTGSTSLQVNSPAKFSFHAAGGARGYKNWSVKGLPATMKSSGSGYAYSTSGVFTKAGLYQAVVSVQDSRGLSATITIPITVLNSDGAVTTSISGVEAQLVSATSTHVSWEENLLASKYLVTVGNKIVCSTTQNQCDIPQLLGPKSQIAVSAQLTDGKSTIPTAAVYKASSTLIQLLVVKFDLNKSALKSADQIRLKALAKLMITQGFTSIQVIGFTDSQGNDAINTPLSAARAKSTFQYLHSLLSGTPLSVSLVAAGSKNPVAPNTTKEGQAENRRAVIYLN